MFISLATAKSIGFKFWTLVYFSKKYPNMKEGSNKAKVPKTKNVF